MVTRINVAWPKIWFPAIQQQRPAISGEVDNFRRIRI